MRRPASTPSAERVRIERIGADGDGVGSACGGQPVYIPLTLPGETVAARVTGHRGAAEAILDPSPARVEPPCPHFGACGGCTLQHWRDAEYIGWKAEQVEAALRRAGYDELPAMPAARTPPASRRRIDLALRRTRADVIVGLHRARSAEIIDLHTCLVIDPALLALIAPLRAALAETELLKREGSAIVNLLDSGPDLLLRTDAAPTTADRTALIGFARAQGIARIAWARGNEAPEPICVLSSPATLLAGTAVTPPPGAFLQSSPQGERAIVDAVLDGLGTLAPRAHVIELYCGCGANTFALATRARVVAFDGDAAAIAALRLAAPSGRVTATVRDLARQPLTAKEIAGAAALVLDPPYAGAIAQMPAIAAARPSRVVYVSCNPAALARDARALRDAGYALRAVTLVDQFLWSARVESVCVFSVTTRRRAQ